MLRRLSFGGPALVTSAVLRKYVSFTQQSPVLENNAKAKGYTSNVWVEVEQISYLKLEPKAGEAATTASIPKQIELWNLDELQAPVSAEPLPPTAQHTSYKTKKPYGQSMAFELDSRATTKSLSSRYWIHPATAKKEGFVPKPNARTALVLIRSDIKLFNADQLTDPKVAKELQVSGGTRKPWSSAMGDVLRQHMIAKGFRTGLWFTTKQVAALNLEVQPGAEGFMMSEQSDPFELYNLTQIEGWEKLAAELGRLPVGQHAFFNTGEAIVNLDSLPLLDATNFPSKYWLSKREVETKQYKLVPNAKPVMIPRARRIEFVVYNADQFVNPDAAFKAAGTLTR